MGKIINYQLYNESAL